MEKTETCPGCHNHCPKEELKCDTGREYFQNGGVITAGEGRSHHGHEHGRHAGGDKTNLSGLLRFCGHKLHHGGDTKDLYSALSQEEQNILIALLTKLTEAWE